MIEKARSSVTDGTGQYRIVSLSPGIYTVTFSLPGFSTVKREGIELTGNFTATVNADLKVGALEETITVSGASPLVDVQSVTKQTVMTREMIDALPTARSIQAAAVLIPGVTTSRAGGGRDVGGTTKLQQPATDVSRARRRTSSAGTGSIWATWPGANTGGGNQLLRQRCGRPGTDLLVGRRFGRDGQPGLYIDMVPKDGGNRFSGVVFGDFTHEPWTAEQPHRRR